MHQRNRHRYPVAGPDSPVTLFDLLSVLDTHGLVLCSNGKGQRSPESKVIRRLYRHWIALLGIRPDLAYVMPLRVAFELLSASHGGRLNERGSYAWRVLTDAVNDPHSGLTIVRRPYQGRRVA